MRVTEEQREYVYAAVEAAGADDFSEWARPLLFKAAEQILGRPAPTAGRPRRREGG